MATRGQDRISVTATRRQERISSADPPPASPWSHVCSARYDYVIEGRQEDCSRCGPRAP